MAIALIDLVKDLVAADVLAEFKAAGELLGISPYAMETKQPIGSVLSLVASKVTTLWNGTAVLWIRSSFFDFAEGDWLTLRAWTGYNRYRNDKTFGVGDVVLENRGGGFYTVAAGNVRCKNGTGKTFTNTTGGTLTPWLGGANPFPTLSVTVQADEAGSASNTAPNGILAYPTPLVQGYTNVFARTNAAAIVGSDAERDAALKTRARVSTGPLSPGGPKSAYESIALDVRKDSNGDPVLPFAPYTDAAYKAAQALNITRVKPFEAGGNQLTIYLASAAGAAAGTSTTPGTDVYVANVAIQLWATPWGMTVNVAPAPEQAVAIGVITLYVKRDSRVTVAEAEAGALTELGPYFETFPIGGERIVAGGIGYLFKESLEAKAQSGNAGIFKAVASGFADTIIGATSVVVPAYTVHAVLVTQ
jgi:hypothetical protein